MEAKRILFIKSDEMKQLLERKTNKKRKRSLYHVVVYKIALLLELAHSSHIYAYKALIEIRLECIKLLDKLNDAILIFEKNIHHKGADFNAVQHPILKKETIAFSNPLHHQLGEILEKFDRLICLITLVKNMGGFSEQNAYFCVKDKYKKQLYRFLSGIIKANTRNMPFVTFENYLNQDEVYQKASKEHGVINPQVIENAIRSTATPNLSAKELNHISYRLKKMAQGVFSK